MFLNKYNVIGVLGGMGPAATVDYFETLIKEISAEKDQDHVPILIFNNPKIPDRTSSVDNKDFNKINKYLTESVKILEEGGADLISIPCNTVHYFYDIMQNAVNIPVLNMIEETAIFIKKSCPEVEEVGLLGTSGTIKSGLYQEQLSKFGIKSKILNDNDQQNLVMKAIYNIKSYKNLELSMNLLLEAIEIYKNKNITTVVLGCTEIPILIKEPVQGINIINPTHILATRSLELVLNPEKMKERLIN